MISRSRFARIAAVVAFFAATSAEYKSCASTYSDHTPIPRGQELRYKREHPDQEIRLEWIPRTYQPNVYIRNLGGGSQSPDLVGLLSGSSSDLDVSFGGKFAFGKPKGKDARTYKDLSTGTIVRGYAVASGGSSLRVSATALVRFKSKAAGAICMSFSLKATHEAQEAYGTFKVDGGTGQGARLYGNGSFSAVDQTGVSTGYSAQLGFDPTVGKARPVPSICGNPPKVKVPKGNKVTASAEGFAVTTSPPSSSTALTAADGTITTCQKGGSLYGVLDYSGPSSTKAEGATFLGSSSDGQFDQPLKQGRNVIKLVKSPANGSYSVKLEIVSTKGATLTGTTLLLPDVTVSCS
jgi:hypothetical protein